MRPSLNSMTVSAADHALCYFFFSLRNAFCVANVDGFKRRNMIEMKSRRVKIKPTVTTPARDFILVQPSSYFRSALIGGNIFFFSISRLLKPLLSPRLTLFGTWLFANTETVLTSGRAELCCSLCQKTNSAPSTNIFFWSCGFPRRHMFNNTIDVYLRKHDIFQATYEKVED